jgi:hypothetical protein
MPKYTTWLHLRPVLNTNPVTPTRPAYFVMDFGTPFGLALCLGLGGASPSFEIALQLPNPPQIDHKIPWSDGETVKKHPEALVLTTTFFVYLYIYIPQLY